MKARVAIMRKTKSTMKLDRAVGGEAVGRISRSLCHAYGNFANALVAKAVCCAVQMRARFFILDISVDGRVLQRLIFADNLSELLAGLQIAYRIVNHALRTTTHFRALQKVCGLLNMRQC